MWHAQALGAPQRLQVAVDCAVKILRTAVVADQVLGPNDLPAIIDALYKLSSASNTGTLAHLLSLANAKRAPKCALNHDRFLVDHPCGPLIVCCNICACAPVLCGDAVRLSPACM